MSVLKAFWIPIIGRTTLVQLQMNVWVCVWCFITASKSLCQCHQTSQQLLIIYTQNLFQICLKKDLHFTNRHCILHPFSLSMSKATKEHPELILPAKTLLLLMQLIFKANFCDACTKGKLPQFSRQQILWGAHLISGN